VGVVLTGTISCPPPGPRSAAPAIRLLEGSTDRYRPVLTGTVGCMRFRAPQPPLHAVDRRAPVSMSYVQILGHPGLCSGIRKNRTRRRSACPHPSPLLLAMPAPSLPCHARTALVLAL
jgi:hypothetical protein